MISFAKGAIAAVASIVMFTGVAQAQFVSGQAEPIVTVKQVLEQGKDDQLVTLQGKIVRQIKSDKYEFVDNTGKLIVEIDPPVFQNQKVTPETLVKISGEVDKEFVKNNEVDVKKLVIVK